MGDVNTVGLKRSFVTLCRDLGGIGVDRHGKLSSKVPERLRVETKKAPIFYIGAFLVSRLLSVDFCDF